ncbi:isoprenyl transferase [Hoeflea prorocentri]|uniref:Isoprenyl transferase n=2 Tax=Hoeflea prorocentri TaxID=1922333 RepID=A0A9X3UGM7_9HYPH|nr:isoprenyl transferase [Hoeflea prorocentri]MCY6380942.1 isoprenyl transferase [Hoeflea prorocentri]MDA5398742.1 isoprenyl transferase [Hoeflea prorocentri]
MNTPQHVAIIMDGNGRWAQRRGQMRTTGHRMGVEAVREAVRSAGELGIRYLTLFAFSSENWSRPEDEVNDLMGLLKFFVRRDLAELHREGVRVRVIGNRRALKADILSLLAEAEDLTRNNSALELIIAFNYGGRDDIARAARGLVDQVARGELDPQSINEDAISNALDTAGIPDPDLIIRTSGEQRISNFLIWQAAYAEFVFLPCLWPDFGRADFEEAIRQYSCRDRRFGSVAERDLALGS